MIDDDSVDSSIVGLNGAANKTAISRWAVDMNKIKRGSGSAPADEPSTMSSRFVIFSTGLSRHFERSVLGSGGCRPLAQR